MARICKKRWLSCFVPFLLDFLQRGLIYDVILEVATVNTNVTFIVNITD